MIYCVSISVFASLVSVLVDITSSAVGLNMCAFLAGVKKTSVNNQEKEEKAWQYSAFRKN